MMEYIYKMTSPVGKLTLASDGSSITGLWIDGQKYYASTLENNAVEKELPVFIGARKWLDCYFKGSEPDFSLPLSPKGSPFRQSVWKCLLDIPYGHVETYGAIGKKLAQGDKRVPARAVGGAVGHNPISILIPCHRVIGADGSLTGFAGGTENKAKLLKLENADIKI